MALFTLYPKSVGTNQIGFKKTNGNGSTATPEVIFGNTFLEFYSNTSNPSQITVTWSDANFVVPAGTTLWVGNIVFTAQGATKGYTYFTASSSGFVADTYYTISDIDPASTVNDPEPAITLSGSFGTVTGGDDGYAYGGATGSVTTNYASDYNYAGESGSTIYYGGFRFSSTTLSPYSTIKSAALSFEVLYTGTGIDGAAVDVLTFYGNKILNPGAWSASDNPRDAARTTASTVFSTNQRYSNARLSFDVKNIVTEILAQSGWAAGNSLRIVAHPSVIRGDFKDRRFDIGAYEYNYSKRPFLDVTWSPNVTTMVAGESGSPGDGNYLSGYAPGQSIGTMSPAQVGGFPCLFFYTDAQNPGKVIVGIQGNVVSSVTGLGLRIKNGNNILILPPNVAPSYDSSFGRTMLYFTYAGRFISGQTYTISLADIVSPTISNTISNTVGETKKLALTLTANEAVTWSIVGGVDASKFEVVGSTLRWLNDGVKDYEAPDDTGSNNVYDVIVRATDPFGNYTNKAITVQVIDYDEKPLQLTVPDFYEVSENTAFTGNLTANKTVTWSIVGGADASQFTISDSSLLFSGTNSRDFELPADADGNSVYLVTVRATDDVGSNVDKSISVRVTDVADGPVIRAIGAAGPISSTMPSTYAVAVPTNRVGDRLILFVETANQPIPTPSGWSIVANSPQVYGSGGTASAGALQLFTKEVTGTEPSTLSIANPGDHFFAHITSFSACDIHATRGNTKSSPSLTCAFPALTTTVANCLVLAIESSLVDTSAPLASSWTNGFIERADASTLSGNGGGIAWASKLVVAAGSVGATQCAMSSSTQNATMMVALSARVVADTTAPTILSATSVNIAENTVNPTGTLSADEAVTWNKVPGGDQAFFSLSGSTWTLNATLDFEAKSSYAVTFRATDAAGNFTNHNFTVNVTNVAPVITSNNTVSVAENQTLSHQLTANEPVTWSVSGIDGSHVELSGNTLRWAGNGTKDYESPGDNDANNVYVVNVTAYDGSVYSYQTINITVTDVDDVPLVITSPDHVSVPENTTNPSGTLTANKPGVMWEIVGGPDRNLFSLNNNVWTLNVTPDYETQDSYIVVFYAYGAGGVEQDFTVYITNVAPAITSPSSITFAENTSNPSGTLASSESSTWSIVGGADQVLFSLSGNIWTLNAVLDYEGKSSYVVIFRATDGGGATTNQTFTLNVSNALPIITSANSLSVLENQPLFHQLTSNETVAWTITGGSDQALFELSGSILRWLNNGFRDFEVPGDGDLNNTYVVQVCANDGSGNFRNPSVSYQTITVTVTDVIEAKPFTYVFFIM